MNDRLVWIDCEMTGLDLAADALIEVAALVTDFDLAVLGEGVDIVVRPPAQAVAQMGDYVRSMHESSGLLAELDRGMTIAEAEQQVLDYVRRHCPEGSRPPLAGNTVATDRSFLARDMPRLESFLHYRIVDVSSIKELARRWYPRAYYQAPAKQGNHRALVDIQESIEELRYYREAVFVPPPGPDSDLSRAIAARHRGALTGAEPSDLGAGVLGVAAGPAGTTSAAGAGPSSAGGAPATGAAAGAREAAAGAPGAADRVPGEGTQAAASQTVPDGRGAR